MRQIRLVQIRNSRNCNLFSLSTYRKARVALLVVLQKGGLMVVWQGLRRGWLVAAICIAATAAQAQKKSADPTPSAPKIEEVVVTGSRIARPDLDRLQPTTIVSAASFDERGYTDVGQALGELPAFGVQPSSTANQQSAYGVGQSFVDLYSLGSQRTLTLV